MALETPEYPALITGQKTDALSEVEVDEAQGGPGPDDRELTDDEIVSILEGYRTEAEYARLAGPNSRDLTWLQHLDLYYNRWDFSKKAPWQAREVMPEFPQYVDRFAAAMRMALVAQPEFFSISIDNDQEGDLAYVIRKFMNVQLRRIGRNATGQPVDFAATFEEAMKMGALSMPVFKTSYKDDEKTGYTSLEVVDPYNFWFDPTGRGLYRIHREEMDLHELRTMMELDKNVNDPLFNREACESALVDGAAVQAIFRAEREKRTGTGQWYQSSRKPIVLHEYYCTLIDNQGIVRGKNVLCIVANNRWLIRGPEANPFLHGRDWMVAAPIITVPLAPYGRAYAENFSQLTRTFNEMTNLILDGIMATTMKVFSVVPGYLEDASQLEDGIYPNAMFRLIEGITSEEFMKAVDMGSLDPNAFNVWQMLKKELQEGAAFNDMTLGNAAPQARTSATEINTVDSNSTSYMRAIASNIETLLLEPTLDLIWKTSIQHFSMKDTELVQAIGEQWAKTFVKMRKQFAEYKVTFVCRGITSLLARKQKLQEFLQFLQICAQNPQMSQVLTSTWPPEKLFKYLAMLMDVDVNQLEGSPREMQILQISNQNKQQQAQQVQVAAEKSKNDSKEDAKYRTQAKLEMLKHTLTHMAANRQQRAATTAALAPTPSTTAASAAPAQGAANGQQAPGPAGPR
jgi:hypothetical protein